MREARQISEGQWQVLARQREEMAVHIARLRVELDTRTSAKRLLNQFEELSKEYHEMELLMAN
jgi:hypothetical protein